MCSSSLNAVLKVGKHKHTSAPFSLHKTSKMIIEPVVAFNSNAFLRYAHNHMKQVDLIMTTIEDMIMYSSHIRT